MPRQTSAEKPVDVKQTQPNSQPSLDVRALYLQHFFQHYRCPAVNYTLINDYIQAADQYGIDYRILPAISIAESTCLRFDRYNNGWGFWSDTKGFASYPSGIDFISQQLATGTPYRGKTVTGKLTAYNNINYARKVEQLMLQIQNVPIN